MSEAHRRSALAHRDAAQGTPGLSVGLREINDRAMIDVRGLMSDGDFMGRIESALGLALPKTPRTSASKDSLTVLWLSVDQWLITAPHSQGTELVKSIGRNLEGVHCLITDMSDARAIFRLEGDAVRGVLNKGTSVDFTAAQYTAGSVRTGACRAPASRRHRPLRLPVVCRACLAIPSGFRPGRGRPPAFRPADRSKRLICEQPRAAGPARRLTYPRNWP
jgi:heterotetrameric sarcosine oxidase gamma subunit